MLDQNELPESCAVCGSTPAPSATGLVYPIKASVAHFRFRRRRSFTVPVRNCRLRSPHFEGTMSRVRFAALTFYSALLVATGIAHAQTTNAGSPEFFETKVRPILANNCYGCHTNSAMGGLRLDSLDGLKKGGKRGPALVPGDADKSLL